MNLIFKMVYSQKTDEKQKMGRRGGWKLSESYENQRIDEQSERVFSPPSGLLVTKVQKVNQ